MKKKLKKMLLTVFAFVFMMGMVSAETVSNSFTVTSYKYSGTPMSFPQTFRVKKTGTGKYAYCTYYSKNPPTGQKYTKGKLVTDNGMNYILKQSMIDNANSNSDFFVYQTALWVYMADKGLMQGAYNSVKTFRNSVNNSSSTTAKKIRTLVSNAKKASSNDTSNPTISVAGTSNVKFTLSGNKYVSDKITVTSSTKDFNVSITNAPSGTTYEKGNGYIRLIVPANKVSSLSTNINFKVDNSKIIYQAYYYNTSASNYQPVAVPFKTTKTASAKGVVKLNTTKDVTISKQDVATSNELPGAKLQLINSNGKIMDSWTSGTTAHVVKGLAAGTYTLKETVAPDGYVLSEESVVFTINSNGKLVDENGKSIDKVVMYNKAKETPETPKNGGVSISKQDITSKKELPGASLVVKDYDGNVIDEWVSTSEPHLIENLTPGIYTLNEVVAPDGYILSDETITFTVKDDGSVTEVVMYNTKDSKEEVEVEDTASFKSIIPTVFGLSIIVMGVILILKNKKIA